MRDMDILGVVAAIATPVFGAFGFLINRIIRYQRHEVNDMKQTVSNLAQVVKSLNDQLRAHEDRDNQRFEQMEAHSRDRHEEVLGSLTEIKVDLAKLGAK